MTKTRRLLVLVAVVCTALGVGALVEITRQAPPGPSACGAALTKPSGGYWRCTFVDNFEGTTLNRRHWVPQQTSNSGYVVGPECYVNSPHNIAVSGGVLRLTARKVAAPFTCASPNGNFRTQYTGASVTTYDLFTQTYGRFDIRARFPHVAGPGSHSALWLYPQDPTFYGASPASGEIDIGEYYSAYPDRVVPFVHYNAASANPHNTNTSCLVDKPWEWHRYSVEWTSKSITVKYDDKTCLVNRWSPAAPLKRPAPFDKPYLVALTQALGLGTNAFRAATTPLPLTTQIDWVHVYR